MQTIFQAFKKIKVRKLYAKNSKLVGKLDFIEFQNLDIKKIFIYLFILFYNFYVFRCHHLFFFFYKPQ